MSVPPPGAEVQRRNIDVRFDIDCGELVVGHRFIARGLSYEELVSAEEMAKIEPIYKPGVAGDQPYGSYFHQFVVPEGGFADDDSSGDAEAWRSWQRRKAQIAAAPKIRGVCLHYELAPGIPESDAEDGRSLFNYLVGVDFHSDVPLATDEDDSGVMEPAKGGPTTYGKRGPWPIADGARLLTFRLLGPGNGFPGEDTDGELRVDLADGAAHWVATTP